MIFLQSFIKKNDRARIYLSEKNVRSGDEKKLVAGFLKCIFGKKNENLVFQSQLFKCFLFSSPSTQPETRERFFAKILLFKMIPSWPLKFHK